MASPDSPLPGETRNRGVPRGQRLLEELLAQHRGKTLGALIGLVVSLMFKILGFFWGVFVLISVLVGYLIGKRLDEDGIDFIEFLDEVIPRPRR